MYSLTDIAIYNLFDPLEIPESKVSSFANESRFICELYHENMNGYKPPKTSRICLDMTPNKGAHEPWYFGAILHCFFYFDIESYLVLNKIEKCNFLLDYIHKSILTLSKKLSWEDSFFISAYQKTKESNFTSKVFFPAKLAPDRQKKGQAILEKTEGKIILSLHLFGNNIDETTIIVDKQNGYPSDFTNKIAKFCKWVDNEKFGYHDSKKGHTIWYNLLTKKRLRNFKFPEEDWKP